jgi:signal transduction histidine kinase/ligand-binding sensor domain-containing protein/DNA-binding response OmpR family regulator
MNGSSFPHNRISTAPGGFQPALRTGFIALLITSAVSHRANAQDQLLPVFHFQSLAQAEGLSNDIRSNIVRDRDGYLWVGTVAGVVRYDGYEFRHYAPNRGDPHALASDHPFAILSDSRGRLWVGTMYGNLSLYVPERDNFSNISLNASNPSSVRDDWVSSLYEDRTGALWVGTAVGLHRVRFLPGSEQAPPDSLSKFMAFDRFPLVYPRCDGIRESPDGDLLVGARGGLFKLDRAEDRFERVTFTGDGASTLNGSVRVNALAMDDLGFLWIGTSGKGLFKTDAQRRVIRTFVHFPGDPYSISSNNVWALHLDSRGWLWVGTETGVDLFDRKTGRCIPYLAAGRSPRKCWSLAMSTDSSGTLWIGTLGNGLFRLSPRSFRFPHYAVRDFDESVVDMGMIDVREERALWSGHNSAVLIDPVRRTTVGMLPVDERANGGNGTARRSWLRDTSGNVWCGLTVGREAGMFVGGGAGSELYRFDLLSGKMSAYSYAPQFPGIMPYWVRGLAAAPGGRLWVAGYNVGLLSLDPVTGVFSQRTPGIVAWNVFKASSGKLWIGTDGDGLYVYDPRTDSTERFRNDPGDPASLSHDFVIEVFEDAAGRIWVGTRSGLDLFDPGSRSFSHVDAGTPGHDWDAGIIADDDNGGLWVGYTGRVLSHRNRTGSSYVDYDTTDGLCGSVITGLKRARSGWTVITGRGGLNIFHQDSLDYASAAPRLVITRMSVNDRPVATPRMDGDRGPLVLPYDRNVVAIEFAAVEFDAQQYVRFQYRLEGLDKTWVEPSGRRFVRYAGLGPGEYTFRIRAVNLRGFWPPQEAALALTITPPWWQTTWAYVGYGLLAFGLLFGGYRLRMHQVGLKQRAELEHVRAKHLAEVDRMKSRFFANISHEFRTPLTLILGPISKWNELLDSGEPSLSSPATRQSLSRDLGMMQRSARRLLRLINQLLDLSKLEAGAMKLRASRINIVPLVRGVANSFESAAGMRGVGLEVDAEAEEIELYADREMLEKTVANLLSNALKFTPEGGSVRVLLRRVPPGGGPRQSPGSRSAAPLHPQDASRTPAPDGHVELSVSDTGIGIPADKLDRVFDRFYQVDSSHHREHEGSGIGLAFVKELVEIHHGTVRVESEEGKGSVFTVQLRLGRDHLKDEEVVEPPARAPVATRGHEEAVAAPTEASAPDPGPADATVGRPIVLIAEDNPDVRGYIREYLVPEFRVDEARDGAEGVAKALEGVPDLVISDVMMPKMDGYEVCRVLKGDQRTSHIPVILLTAKAGSESVIEGLETGADDYLIKPFEPKELLARVRNLIELRKTLRQKFNVGTPLRPGEISVTSVDDAFLNRVREAVERGMADEAFTVEQLAEEVCMSRMQLHRKLTSLTGLAAGDFIRYMRLHRAMAMLKGHAGTVSEIAFRVGFSDPSYFSKCFHRQFSITPSEVQKEA